LFFGIDLTATEQKPSACVCLNASLDAVYCKLLSTDDALVDGINRNSPEIVAIDAPLSLPSGFCCLDEDCMCHLQSREKRRLSERELARSGIPCYFTTKKSIIKKMVGRAVNLKRELEGLGYTVIEVYPYASKVCLFGTPVPRKTTTEGLAWLRNRIKSLINYPEIPSWNHDLCDAALAAYTGYLYVKGDVDMVGDVGEGLIYIPKGNSGRTAAC
jgi:predicted nuclease with RNAse H fold